MSWLAKLIVIAASAEAAVAALAFMAGGSMAAVAALVGSGVALSFQIAAIVMLRPGMTAPGAEFLKRWSGGIAARFVSFLVVTAIIIGFKSVLPPIWVATGYLIVLLTLLFAETVFLK